MKAVKTQTMIRAALVMTRAVEASPVATETVASPVARQASWVRERSAAGPLAVKATPTGIPTLPHGLIERPIPAPWLF
jgi:hypothetical protein